MMRRRGRNRYKEFFLMSLGIIFIIWGIVIQILSNFNIGYILTIMLGIFFLIYGKFYIQVKEIVPSPILKLIKSGLLLVFCWMIFLFVYGKTDTTDYKEDVVIILGAGLRGDQLSLSLLERVKKGMEYLEKNPDAIAIVSGGQGPDELVAESYAMKKYMVENGIDENRIIEENQSTSTFENFLLSKKILDKNFHEDYKVVYVTSDFHTFRSGRLAKRAGIENPNRKASSLKWYMYPMTYLRETLACGNLIINQNKIRE